LEIFTLPSGKLREWIDNNMSMLLVDTMPYEDSYKKNHLPGAKQMAFPIPELTTLDDKTRDELLELLGSDKNRTIVFYCGFTKCTRSHNAAMWAVRLGYNDVYRLPGGVKAWKEAGYPLDSVK
jgi:rhodanese-related sulfurtransferase